MRKKSLQERRNADIYGHVPSCDREEMIENRKATHGLNLLRMIEENLDPSEFSLEEIKNSFNALVFSGVGGSFAVIRYGQSHLNWLVEKKFIAINEERGKMFRVIRSIESLPSRLKHLYPEEEE